MRDRLTLLIRLLAFAVAAGLTGAGCVSQTGDDLAGKQGAAIDVCASAPEGALCDDGNVCTVFDVCKSGICKGSNAPNGTLCTDGNTCTTGDSCRGGMCKGDPSPNTTPCNDGDPCTVGDFCMAASCMPGAGALSCNDGMACTLDLCVAGFGCLFSPIPNCTPPRDAGPDVADAKADLAADAVVDAKADVAADVKPDAAADLKVDAMMSIDVAAEVKADVVSPPDLMTPVDLGKPEAAPDVPADKGGGDVPGEAGGEVGAIDAGADAGEGGADASEEDARTDASVDADASVNVDAGADAKADADAKVDLGTLPALPMLHASGGACNCATAPSASEPVVVLAFVLAAVLVLGRRRRGAG